MFEEDKQTVEHTVYAWKDDPIIEDEPAFNGRYVPVIIAVSVLTAIIIPLIFA